MKYTGLLHIVPQHITESLRLSRYLVGVFPMLETGQSVKKAIKKGEINVDGQLASTATWVMPGMEIRYHKAEPVRPSGDFQIPIVYEDEHLMVLNKPAGLTSSGNTGRSLQSELMKIRESSVDDALAYPLLIHRLDRATSGLIIAARSMSARRILAAQLERGVIQKKYVALVAGHIMSTTPVLIDHPLDGKSACTTISKCIHLETRDRTTFVEVLLSTGRTHQIRRHLATIEHPIVGDQLYNAKGLDFGRGLFLMSYSLSFRHPIDTRLIEVDTTIHDKFQKYLK